MGDLILIPLEYNFRFKDAFCCKSNLGGADTEASLPIAEVSPKNIFFN